MNTAVAGVLALFVGVMLAFLKEYVSNYKEREREA
jgi:capsular polysaccharide biosynthesis protein